MSLLVQSNLKEMLWKQSLMSTFFFQGNNLEDFLDSRFSQRTFLTIRFHFPPSCLPPFQLTSGPMAAGSEVAVLTYWSKQKPSLWHLFSYYRILNLPFRSSHISYYHPCWKTKGSHCKCIKKLLLLLNALLHLDSIVRIRHNQWIYIVIFLLPTDAFQSCLVFMVVSYITNINTKCSKLWLADSWFAE